LEKFKNLIQKIFQMSPWHFQQDLNGHHLIVKTMNNVKNCAIF